MRAGIVKVSGSSAVLPARLDLADVIEVERPERPQFASVVETGSPDEVASEIVEVDEVWGLVFVADDGVWNVAAVDFPCGMALDGGLASLDEVGC